MENKPIVEAYDLSFDKGGRKIFSSLNLSLYKGQAIFIKGRNGSGKTSLLKCLAGFYQISDGKILWFGEKILPAFYADRPLVSWLGHLDAIKGSLSVRQNLLFYAKVWSVKQNIYNEAIKKLSFEKFLDFPASWLSAGERRRLSMIRLLFCPAKIWILDEPSTFLDKYNRSILENIMDLHIKNDGAIVCATHENFNISNSKELILV